MPAHPKYEGLCLNHATIHRRTYHREDDLVKELASPAGDFITQIDINHVLGKLFEALAANRVSPKRAATLAYIPPPDALPIRRQKRSQHLAHRIQGPIQTSSHQIPLRTFRRYRLPRPQPLSVADPITQILIRQSTMPLSEPAEAMFLLRRRAIFHFHYKSNVSPTYITPTNNSFLSHTYAKTGGYTPPKNVGAPTFSIFPLIFAVFLRSTRDTWERRRTDLKVGHYKSSRAARAASRDTVGKPWRNDSSVSPPSR